MSYRKNFHLLQPQKSTLFNSFLLLNIQSLVPMGYLPQIPAIKLKSLLTITETIRFFRRALGIFSLFRRWTRDFWVVEDGSWSFQSCLLEANMGNLCLIFISINFSCTKNFGGLWRFCGVFVFSVSSVVFSGYHARTSFGVTV